MKKVLLSIVAAVFAVSTFAQDGAKVKKTPEQIATKKADKLKTELALSDDQRTKVYTILLESTTKIQAIKAKYPNDKKAAHAEIKPIRETSEASIKAILTPEQVTKWEALKKEKKEKTKAKKAKKDDDDDND